ncbi:MAG: dihydropteroate synthase [Synergistaceae bacterium]|nr:dihydropteroate synthase [Synergistaceae bacterium]
MGILNVNNDSFYPASRASGVDAAAARARDMARCGADVIDIGAESTRPGSTGLDEGAELAALIPVVRAVRESLPGVPISVDTRKAAVASESIRAGADIINDVSGLDLPEEASAMTRLVAGSGAAYVLMHTKGRPETMQVSPGYDEFLPELLSFLDERIERLASAGVARDRIIIDPGVGFGKRFGDNLDILANLGMMRRFGLPILVGASRKGFIGRALGLPDPADRLEGTLAISALCADRGVEVIRVHDVLENRRVVDMIDAVRRRANE